MDPKNMKMIAAFKDKLKSRIVGIWWIICVLFLGSLGLYYFFNKEDPQKNLKIFCIVMALFLAFCASLTIAFYFTRKNKFYSLLSTLDETNLNEEETLYETAVKNGGKKLAIITKEGITFIKGFFMFHTIPAEDLIWIYQFNSKDAPKDALLNRVPAAAIVNNRAEVSYLPGYKVTNLLRRMFPTIFLSIEGSLKHRELQNRFDFDFEKMAEATGHYNHLPRRYDDEANKKNVDINTIIAKKQKMKKIRSYVRMFFMILLQVGIILGLIILALFILSKHPTIGRKALILNILLGVGAILLILILFIKFVTGLFKRSKLGDIVFAVILVLLTFGFIKSGLYKSFLDLKSEPKEAYYSIKYVGYKNAFWLPKESEVVFYVYPVDSKNKNDRVVYSVKKSELKDVEDVIEIMKDENYEELPYLHVIYYPESNVIKDMNLIDKYEYDVLVKKSQ